MHTIKDIVKQLIGKSLDAYNTNYTKVVNTRIDNIVAQAGNDNTEIVDARIDSAGVTHTTLNNRILAETKMNDEQLVEYTGSNISAEDTTQGFLKDVEILGNTIQNEEDLADIKSVGKLQEDGTYKMSILSCGKNLFNPSIHTTLTKVGDEYSVNTVTNNYVNYKLKPNTDYILSFKKSSVDCWVSVDVKNYVNVNNSNMDFYKIYRTDSSGILSISIRANTVDNIGHKIKALQLEEGTVATQYEPYQENKCDILLPCQLEKVGNVSDRLVYKEGVLGIEKNVVDMLFNETNCTISMSSAGDIHPNYAVFDFSVVDNKNYVKTSVLFCDKFNHLLYSADRNSSDKEGCWIGNAVFFTVKILKTKLESVDANGMKKWLKTNNINLKYATTQPQFIPLPRDTQITLNSFFGTTHVYMESGEVEGTIKCKIPKSIGATVQTLNNKTDILSDRIEAIEGLKDSQNMKYETDKGYLICKETKNGVIDDLKIEGKTLVNIHPKATPTLSVSDGTNPKYNVTKKEGYIKVTGSDLEATQYRYVNMGRINFEMFKPNTTYTVVFTKFRGSSKITIQNGNSQHPIVKGGTITAQDNKLLYTFVTTETLVKSEQILYLWVNPNLTTIDIEVENPMIFEGDLTANPPSGYIEGLKSVGDDVDEIEVLSRKEDGNLFDGALEVGSLNASGDTNWISYVKTGLIRVKPSSEVICKIGKYKGETATSTDIRMAEYDMNKNFIKFRGGTYKATVSDKTHYVKFAKKLEASDDSRVDINVVSDVVVVYGNELHDIPHQSDKKRFLYYNEETQTWEKPILREWDSIEKHANGKYYYHQRSVEVVLNGSENWGINAGWSGEEMSTNSYYLTADGQKTAGLMIKSFGATNIISEVMPTVFINDASFDNDCVSGENYSGAIYIRINKSKVLSGIKPYLQQNPMRVVYKLAQEKVYELTPLHLDSYTNETLILCNSGAISPKMGFSITSHINELVKAYGERINLLEEKVYQYMVTQNRMQLASTYSADSVTFKVDYFSLCGDEENYDEDLYNLILNNILVGKDNYNYDKMFTMILDYASWNQISWEQFDILVGLMDIQHNPPVEEETTEDESIEETPVE